MKQTDWAKQEAELAIKRELEGQDDASSYSVGCIQSALKAFNSLMEDGHSGLSIMITKSILNRLIDGKPLTPIEDTDGIWEFAYENDEKSTKVYQCTRMSSLFKTVDNETGKISYTDVNRVTCYEKSDDNHIGFHSGFVTNIIDEKFPITMPYTANDHWSVYCKTFLVDPKNGDFDTRGILYAESIDGEKVDILRYFKDDPDGSSLIEIDSKEFEEREFLSINRKIEEAKNER